MNQREVRGYLAQGFLQFERELAEYESVSDTTLATYANSLRDWFTGAHAPEVVNDVVTLAVALLGEVQFRDPQEWFKLLVEAVPDGRYGIPKWQDLRQGVLCRSKGTSIIKRYETAGIAVPVAMLLLFIKEHREHFQIAGEEVALEALEIQNDNKEEE